MDKKQILESISTVDADDIGFWSRLMLIGFSNVVTSIAHNEYSDVDEVQKLMENWAEATYGLFAEAARKRAKDPLLQQIKDDLARNSLLTRHRMKINAIDA